jgi:DNA-binding MarR family transcriptional regulator
MPRSAPRKIRPRVVATASVRPDPTPVAGRAADGSMIWSRYRDNTARHLMGIARDIQQRAVARLEADAGFVGLRPSLGPVIARIAEEPQALSDLARALSISAQACGQLVDAGAEGGYLERLENAEDRRTRVVALTQRGRQLVLRGAEILNAIEAEDEGRIGAPAHRALAESLGALHQAWSRDDALLPTFPASSHPSLGPLPLISVQIQQRLMEASSARGHVGLKLSHAQVLPLIGAQGARIGTLARVQGLSRQAVSATASDLERLGYVARKGLADDRRAVLLQLTPDGQTLIRDSVEALDLLDEEIRDAIGTRRAHALEQNARALYQALGLEREIFGAGDPEPTPGLGPIASLEALARQLHQRLDRGDRERLAALLAAPTGP